MPAPRSMDPELALALQQGAVLLTVNNRLARHLRDAYEAHRHAAGDLAWETPDILPLGAWLARCHDSLLDLGLSDQRLLAAEQERALWENVIGAAGRDLPLMRPAAAARIASDAYRLLHDWHLEDRPELPQSPEGQAFGQWRDTFEHICRQRDLLPSARLSERLTTAIAEGGLPLPASVRLAGFDALNPAQQTLLDALLARGCDVRAVNDEPRAATPVRLRCTDPAEEHRLAAAWALQRLQADPQARIGIVCPDIQGRREALRQAFTATLAPQVLSPDADPDQALPFNFSLGLPLAEQPLVRDALLALELAVGEIDHGRLSQLLRSPFISGGLSESQARALFDAQLRQRGFPRYPLHRLRQQATRVTPEGPLDCPVLFACLEQLSQAREGHAGKADGSHWARYFQELLALWGWPGERSLNSTEHQQNQAFNSLLGRLARLDGIATPTGARLALQRLRQLAQEAVFQPEGSDAPVQVLGVLETAGLQFDHLWLLGLDDAHWPPAPAPNPLLPVTLQRELELPHGSPARELAFARHHQARLLGAAPEVVISHPRQDADGELGASPLIAAFPIQDATALGTTQTAAGDEATAAGDALQPLHDWQAPPAPPALPGGTPLLADQAACPFRAFARHRLLARGLEDVSHGPDARHIGNQVHRILEQLWRELGDLQTLIDTPPERLTARIDQAVAGAVEELGRERPDLYTDAFRRLEHERLAELTADWLSRETGRAPFTIEALEKPDQVTLGPLTLKVRADRVDRLADGRVVVIDYKTGRNQRTGTWTSERPEEPQVPLYAMQHGEQLAAAVVGRVRLDKDGGFKGLAEAKGLLPGIGAFKGTDQVPDWAALSRHWRQRLTVLAEEIAAGRADPMPGPASCAYCELPALCRVALMDDGGSGDD